MKSWKKILAKIVAALAVLAAAIYGGDYIVLRVRIAKNWNAFGTVEVDRYYSVAEKNNRMEFIPIGTQPETCVHSLFPHMGDEPCWYLVNHAEKQINI